MSLTATDAVVLQCFPYGETSRIVRLLTRTAGVQSAIAKGALRPRSRYAVLEPFAEGMASLHIRSTRDLQTLSGFELARTRHALGRDLLRFGGASLIAEIIMRTGSEDPEPGLFDAVSGGLDLLAQAAPDEVEATTLAITWHVIALLGFAPELEGCVVCGQVVAADAEVALDYAAGGLRCQPCAAGLTTRNIPPHARAALAAFTRGEVVRVEVTGGHWQLLARYLEHHLLDGRPLRSLEFVSTALGTA